MQQLSDADLVLETERLVLKPLTCEDLDIVLELFTDPDVVRYVCDLETPEQLESFLPTECQRGAGGRIGVWTVTRKEENKKIGTGILLPLPIEKDDTDWSLVVQDTYPDAEIEVGYMFIKSEWGKGFATETCRRLLKFSFEKTTLDVITATADPDNHASHHVLEKSGLRSEGLRYAYACQCSSFRISRKDWLVRPLVSDAAE
ncbi:MAG: GNAT family N-acetyltransferase [Rhodobacteraceae bacterium]|nr:GNAT family N-acetyltransferase [Paracoccaceae bacterium]